MNQFICYPKCSTCIKAKKYLEGNEITFTLRDIKEDRLNATELRNLHVQSNLPLKRFFNTSGLKYKELQLKDKLATMSEDEQYELLASDGMLVKRPIFVDDTHVFVGFKEVEYQKLLNV